MLNGFQTEVSRVNDLQLFQNENCGISLTFGVLYRLSGAITSYAE